MKPHSSHHGQKPHGQKSPRVPKVSAMDLTPTTAQLLAMTGLKVDDPAATLLVGLVRAGMALTIPTETTKITIRGLAD